MGVDILVKVIIFRQGMLTNTGAATDHHQQLTIPGLTNQNDHVPTTATTNVQSRCIR